MLNIPLLLSREDYCISHTGLNLETFAYLLTLFEPEYIAHMKALYEEKNDKKRTRALGGGRQGRLKTMEAKLFVVLY